MPNFMPLAAVLLTALFALTAYIYKNRIGFSVTAISGRIAENNDQIKITPSYDMLHGERLAIRNFGIRSLENVELHFGMPNNPAFTNVEKASTLSKRSIKACWYDGAIVIEIASLPSKEEIVIEFFRVGSYASPFYRLTGTGGKYKIVDLDRYVATKNIIITVILSSLPLMVFLAFVLLH